MAAYLVTVQCAELDKTTQKNDDDESSGRKNKRVELFAASFLINNRIELQFGINYYCWS